MQRRSQRLTLPHTCQPGGLVQLHLKHHKLVSMISSALDAGCMQLLDFVCSCMVQHTSLIVHHCDVDITIFSHVHRPT